MEKNTLCFPVVAQDAVNYLIDKYLANSQISCILRLNGKLNKTILQQAVRISLDAEPILGCCFIADDDHPFWELQTNFETSDFFLSLKLIILTKSCKGSLVLAIIYPGIAK